MRAWVVEVVAEFRGQPLESLSAMDSIYNPVQKDRVTFLETARGTDGARTVVDVELAPGGGNSLHYHTEFTERFTVLSGELAVQVADDLRVLPPGESALAPVGVLHRFGNQSSGTAVFRVELTPGHEGFEDALRIAYGLARDGRTNARGVPRNLFELAVLASMSGTCLPGFVGWVTRGLARVAASRRGRSVRESLLQRYGVPFRGTRRDEDQGAA